MSQAVKAMQREVCARYGTVYFPSPASLKVGIAECVRSGDLPLHGLRHPPEGDTPGWYIWAVMSCIRSSGCSRRASPRS